MVTTCKCQSLFNAVCFKYLTTNTAIFVLLCTFSHKAHILHTLVDVVTFDLILIFFTVLLFSMLTIVKVCTSGIPKILRGPKILKLDHVTPVTLPST